MALNKVPFDCLALISSFITVSDFYKWKTVMPLDDGIYWFNQTELSLTLPIKHGCVSFLRWVLNQSTSTDVNPHTLVGLNMSTKDTKLKIETKTGPTQGLATMPATNPMTKAPI